MGAEEDFLGIIDLIEMKAYKFNELDREEVEIPAEYMDEAVEGRNFIIEKVADYNEKVMELFLVEQEVPADLLKMAAREEVLKLLFTPAFCGSAYKNKGVRLLLDAIVDYLPSPIDIGITQGVDIDYPEKTVHRNPSESDPFCALAFKLINDPYVGQQTFIRIYSGTLTSGMQVQNSTKGKSERIGRILQV